MGTPLASVSPHGHWRIVLYGYSFNATRYFRHLVHGFHVLIPSHFSPFLDAVTETLILYLVAKFAIAASFLILYPFAGELYPTEIRGVGIGFTAYLGGLGLVAIPFVNYLVNKTAFYRKEVIVN